MQLHHATLFVSDLDRSLRFYRDGLGLDTLVDREFEGPWQTLFDVSTSKLHAVILGDPKSPQQAQVELLTFAEPVAAGPPPVPPAVSTVMLSFLVDLETVMPAVVAAGGSDVRRSVLRNGHAVATLRDPDGILVELLDAVPQSQRAT